MFRNILLLLCICQLVTLNFGLKKCVNPDSVPIAEDFLIGRKFQIITHNVCDNCDEGDKSYGFSVPKKDLPNTYCWKVNGLVKKNNFTIDLECNFMQPSVEFCAPVPHKVGDPGPIMKGTHIIVKTDNSTYLVGAVCRFGKNNFWYIASTSESLSIDIQHEATNHLASLGFKTGPSQSFGGDHSFVFQNFEAKKGGC